VQDFFRNMEWILTCFEAGVYEGHYHLLTNLTSYKRPTTATAEHWLNVSNDIITISGNNSFASGDELWITESFIWLPTFTSAQSTLLGNLNTPILSQDDILVLAISKFVTNVLQPTSATALLQSGTVPPDVQFEPSIGNDLITIGDGVGSFIIGDMAVISAPLAYPNTSVQTVTQNIASNYSRSSTISTEYQQRPSYSFILQGQTNYPQPIFPGPTASGVTSPNPMNPSTTPFFNKRTGLASAQAYKATQLLNTLNGGNGSDTMYQTVITTVVTIYSNGSFIGSNNQLPNSFQFPSSKEYPITTGSLTCIFNGSGGVNYCYVLPGSPNLDTVTDCTIEHNDGEPVRQVTISNSQLLATLSATTVFSQAAIDCALQIQRTYPNLLQFDVFNGNYDDNYPVTTESGIQLDVADNMIEVSSLSPLAIGFIVAGAVVAAIGIVVLVFFLLYKRNVLLQSDSSVSMLDLGSTADK